MDTETIAFMNEAYGRPIAEAALLFTDLIKALGDQPNIDNEKLIESLKDSLRYAKYPDGIRAMILRGFVEPNSE